jgi:hypothetical protein
MARAVAKPRPYITIAIGSHPDPDRLSVANGLRHQVDRSGSAAQCGLIANAAKIFNAMTIPTFGHPLAVAALFALGLLGCRPPFFSLP